MKSYVVWLLSLQSFVGIALVCVVLLSLTPLYSVEKSTLVPTSFQETAVGNETSPSDRTSSTALKWEKAMSSTRRGVFAPDKVWAGEENGICRGIVSVLPPWPIETEKNQPQSDDEAEEDEDEEFHHPQESIPYTSPSPFFNTSRWLMYAPDPSTFFYRSSLSWMWHISRVPWWEWYTLPPHTDSVGALSTFPVVYPSSSSSFSSSSSVPPHHRAASARHDVLPASTSASPFRIFLPLQSFYLYLHVCLLEWTAPLVLWWHPILPASHPTATSSVSWTATHDQERELPHPHPLLDDRTHANGSRLHPIATLAPGFLVTSLIVTLCGFPFVWRLMVSLAQLLIVARRDRFEAVRLQRVWREEEEEDDTEMGKDEAEGEEKDATSMAGKRTAAYHGGGGPPLLPMSYTAEETTREVYHLALLGTLVFHLAATIPCMWLECRTLYPISYAVVLFIQLMLDLLQDERYGHQLEADLLLEETKKQQKKTDGPSSSSSSVLAKFDIDGPPLFQHGSHLGFPRRHRYPSSLYTTNTPSPVLWRRIVSVMASLFFFFFLFWLPPSLLPSHTIRVLHLHSSMHVIRALAAATWMLFLLPSFLYLLVPLLFWCGTSAIQKAHQPVAVCKVCASPVSAVAPRSRTSHEPASTKHAPSHTNGGASRTAPNSRVSPALLELVGVSTFLDRHALLTLVSCYAGTVLWIGASVLLCGCLAYAHADPRTGGWSWTPRWERQSLPWQVPTTFSSSSSAAASLPPTTSGNSGYIETYMHLLEQFVGPSPFPRATVPMASDHPTLPSLSLTGASALQSPSSSSSTALVSPCAAVPPLLASLLPNAWLVGEYYDVFPVTSMFQKAYYALLARKHRRGNARGGRGKPNPSAAPPTDATNESLRWNASTSSNAAGSTSTTPKRSLFSFPTSSSSSSTSSFSPNFFTYPAQSLYQLFCMLTCWGMLGGVLAGFVGVISYRARAVPSVFLTAVQQFHTKTAHIRATRAYWKYIASTKKDTEKEKTKNGISSPTKAHPNAPRPTSTADGSSFFSSLPSSITLITREEYILKQFLCLLLWLLLALLVVVLLASPLTLTGVVRDEEDRVGDGAASVGPPAFRTAPTALLFFFLPLLALLTALHAMMLLLRWKWCTVWGGAEKNIDGASPPLTTALGVTRAGEEEGQMTAMEAAVLGQPLPVSLWCSPIRLQDRTDGMWLAGMWLAVWCSLAPWWASSFPAAHLCEGWCTLLLVGGGCTGWGLLEGYYHLYRPSASVFRFSSLPSLTRFVEVLPFCLVVVGTVGWWGFSSLWGSGRERLPLYHFFSSSSSSAFSETVPDHEGGIAALAIAQLVQYYTLPAVFFLFAALLRFSYRLLVLCFEAEEMALQRW